jgi:alcohol dehydrogenase class IV
MERIALLYASPLEEAADGLALALADAGLAVMPMVYILGEPTVGDFLSLCEQVRDFRPDGVIGMGGGSVLDTAKLMAAMWDNSQTLEDVFGSNRLRPRRTALIAIPTTSGTGSEVSPNAILLDPQEGEKKGIISPYLIPDRSYIDPTLMLGLPPSLTAETAMDALSHCIEAYTNRFAHPAVDVYALAGIRLIAAHLEKAFLDGSNLENRAALALGSLYGGLCLGPVNTAAVHALSYGLGGKYHIAHGLANAVLLPEVMRFNQCAAPEKYLAIALAFGAETIEDGISRLEAMAGACGIPRKLSALGIEASQVDTLADLAMRVTRLLVNNPREVTRKDAVRIYQALF